MAQPTLWYLSRADVEAAGLSMAEIIAELRVAFEAKGRGEVEVPPKPGIHPRPDAFIHAMPAWVPAAGAAGVKWVSGYPQNQARGLPYIHGLLMLNDPDTGVPTAVMDCTWITAMRTGAATALAAQHLARPDSEVVGLVACGVQGRSNLEALTCVLPVRRVLAYDLHVEVARRFAAWAEERFDVEVAVVERIEEAVRPAHVVVTSGPILREPSPPIPPGWLMEGAFACPLDFDSAWQGGAFVEADLLVTDDVAQLEYYRREGYFRATPEITVDLGDLAAGRSHGRTDSGQRTICINLGLALEDVVTAARVLERARQRGLGTELAL